jgi:hypothetical protein
VLLHAPVQRGIHRRWYEDCKEVIEEVGLRTVNDAVAAIVSANPKSSHALVDAAFEWVATT